MLYSCRLWLGLVFVFVFTSRPPSMRPPDLAMMSEVWNSPASSAKSANSSRMAFSRWASVKDHILFVYMFRVVSCVHAGVFLCAVVVVVTPHLRAFWRFYLPLRWLQQLLQLRCWSQTCARVL